MAYLIHVINTAGDVAHQQEWMRKMCVMHKHHLVDTRYDDVAGALESAKLLGALVIVGTDRKAVKEEDQVTEKPEETDAVSVPSNVPPPKVGPPKVGPPKVGAVKKPQAEEAPAKVAVARTRREKQALARLEELLPVMQELSAQSAKQCAKILTERGTPLPSGAEGEWQTTQVNRVRSNLEKAYGALWANLQHPHQP